MEYIIKIEIWQDKVTGEYYKKDYSFKSIIQIKENEIKKGYVFKPCDVDINIGNVDLFNELMKKDQLKEYGYIASDYVQYIYLENDEIEKRLNYIGEYKKNINTEKIKKKYELENVNFKNKKYLFSIVLNSLLKKEVLSLNDIAIIEILKEYIKNIEDDKSENEMFNILKEMINK